MPVSRNRKKKHKPKQQPLVVPPHNKPSISRQQHTIATKQEFKFYQGLIPHPETMEQYRQIDPSLPMRIVQWTEDEGNHRRAIEKQIVKHSYNTVVWGYVLGFLSVALISLLCYLFMINGNANQGMWIACVVIVALAVVFVLRLVPKVTKPEQ